MYLGVYYMHIDICILNIEWNTKTPDKYILQRQDS